MSQSTAPRPEPASQFFTFALVVAAVLVCILASDRFYDSSDPESRIRRAEIAEKKRSDEEFVIVRRAVPVEDQPEKKKEVEVVAPRAEIVGASDDGAPRVRALRPTEIFPGEGKPLRTVQ